MQINKSDRNDADSIARIMEPGWFKEVSSGTSTATRSKRCWRAGTSARIAAAQKSMIPNGGRPNMRIPASEKLEIVRLVEQSHLPPRRTLQMKPDRVWHRLAGAWS